MRALDIKFKLLVVCLKHNIFDKYGIITKYNSSNTIEPPDRHNHFLATKLVFYHSFIQHWPDFDISVIFFQIPLKVKKYKELEDFALQ